MHDDHLRLRGKTYDYKVAYKQIKRQFSLPKLDEKHWQLIVSGVWVRKLGVGGE